MSPLPQKTGRKGAKRALWRNGSALLGVVLLALPSLGLVWGAPVTGVERQAARMGNAGGPLQALVRRTVLVDPTGDVALGGVLPATFGALPRQATFGYSGSVHYLRLTFPLGVPTGFLLEMSYSQLDQVSVFVPDGAGFSVARFGDLYPFAFRLIPHPTFLFPLPELRSDQAVVIRVESAGSLNLATRVISRESLYQTFGRDSYLFGMYYGIAAVMAFLYLFVFFTVGERSSLYYALHVGFQALFQLSISGMAFQLFWPDSPSWANISAPLFAAASLYFSLRFTREFLELWIHLPIANHFFRLLGNMALWIVPALLLGFLSVGTRAVTVVVMLFTPAVLIAASILWSQGYRPARLFLLGWSAFLVGILLYALFLLGLVRGNFLLQHSIQVGSGMQMLILALAITARIGNLRKEKELAQAFALSSERRRRRLQEKMAYRLQRQVERRTAELSEVNARLLGRDREVRRELELASQIQRGLLPPEIQELPGLRVATHCRYVTGVGGDYLDIFRFRGGPFGLSGGSVGILSADVAGHGIPAALVTSMAKICFQDAVRAHKSPRRVLLEVNRTLLATIASGSYLTAFYMTIDERYGVRYCGGGHPDPLVFRADRDVIETWSAAGFLIGALDGMEGQFEEKRDRLAPGDRVLLYTDGLTEARTQEGVPFGVPRLADLFLESARMPPAAALRFLLDSFEELTLPDFQEDDYSLVLVEADPLCQEGQAGGRHQEHPDRRAADRGLGSQEDIPE